MTALRLAIDDSVALRRRLGGARHEAARVLHLFADFAEREGAPRVTTDLARRWATHFPNLSPVSVNTRFQIVRRFAEWRHVTDPLTEIPPIDLLPARYHRKPPSLYQDADIDRLLEAARQLPSPMGLRGLTYTTLFGLLAVTGLRISEALALDDADVQRPEAKLTVRRSKFGKSRLTPLHASTIERLAVYARTRDRVFPRRVSPAVFLSEQGTRVTIWAAEYTFAKVSGQIGLRPPIHGHRHGHGPRLHDLRHRFAIRTLVRWYRAGLDVDPLLPLLATRLAAIHAFCRYVAIGEPAHLDRCRRILAIPTKRHERRPIAFLCREEIDALVAAPNPATWIGRRDRTLLVLAIQTGLRVSELIQLRCADVIVGTGAHVRCMGKGRKQRCTPMHRETAVLITAWLRERNGPPGDPVFPTARGATLSRDAVERLVTRHTKTAQRRCASLTRKHVSPHVLRHTAAMELLGHGVDRAVIALWLGHESVETTQMYLHADRRIKEHALARTTPAGVTPGRYRPTDRLLAFLEGL